MKNNYIFRKALVLGVLFLFFGAVVLTGVSGINNNLTNNTKVKRILSFDPFIEGWEFRKQITINHDYVESDLDDFPVFINTDDDDLLGKVQSDADDILFMDGLDSANQLFHEIERYDDNTGELEAWVQVPDLMADEDTVIYMYYGNPTCNNQENPEMVWDEDYIAVYHMDGSDFSEVDDSTSNNLDVVGKTGSPVYNKFGKTGYCVDFNDGDTLYINDNDLLSFTSGSNNDEPATFEAWVKHDEDGGDNNPIICKYGDNGKEWLFRKHTDDLGQLYLVDDSMMASIFRKTLNELKVDNAGWNYFCGIYDGSNSGNGIDLMVDGALDNGEIWTGGNYAGMENKNENVYIGGYKNPTTGWFYWYGLIDEIRISGVVRSSDWLNTCFNTINDPYSFLSFGDEETLPPPDKPYITGPTSGSANVGIEYTFIAFDPKDKDVYFWIEWGDGNIEEWLGPYDSGESVILSHTWTEKAEYIIEVKAKNSYDIESVWAQLLINIPRIKMWFNFFDMFPVLQRFLQFIK